MPKRKYTEEEKRVLYKTFFDDYMGNVFPFESITDEQFKSMAESMTGAQALLRFHFQRAYLAAMKTVTDFYKKIRGIE